MRHILLAIDRGAPSWEAARLTVHLAPRLKVPITVLSVVVPGRQRKDIKDQRLREYEAVRELVDDVVRELVTAGVRAKGEVRSSSPGQVDREILASATRLRADLIVMGSRARTQLTGLLFGSVSQGVAMGASCPVIIVPAGATAKVSPKRIVLAIDSQGDLNRPVATTIELARALKAGVEVLCVGGTVRIEAEAEELEELLAPENEVIAKAVSSIRQAGIVTQFKLVPDLRGLTAGIAQEAMASAADMIVIGSRALGWIGGDVAAGTAAAVARRTGRPVVIAPARRSAGQTKRPTKGSVA